MVYHPISISFLALASLALAVPAPRAPKASYVPVAKEVIRPREPAPRAPKASYVPLAKEVVRRPRELETREPKVVVGGIVSVGGMPGFGSVGAVAGTAGRIASGVRTADKITGAVDAASGTPKQVIMIDKPKVQTGGALIDPSKGKKKKRSEMDLDLE